MLSPYRSFRRNGKPPYTIFTLSNERFTTIKKEIFFVEKFPRQFTVNRIHRNAIIIHSKEANYVDYPMASIIWSSVKT